MFAPPKSLVTLGATFLGKVSAWKLRGDVDGRKSQEKVLQDYTKKTASTEYGKEHGISAHLPADQFRRNTPLQTYENFIPYIERMKRGEADVLWPGRCAYYAVSSGTTSGRTKYLPITGEMIAHFRKAGLDSLFYYTSRVKNSGLFQGRHLFLGGATVLTALPESEPFKAYGGDLSGITALNLPTWVEKHLYEPGADIAQMADWPSKIRAITERCWNKDITLIGGIPSWILILAESLMHKAVAEGQPVANLRSLWPNLECLVHGGVPLSPFQAELRKAMGTKVNFHEVYPASEGFIAAQDSEPEEGLRLMTDAGIFYEFLPLSDYDETRLAHLGKKVVPLEGVQPGVDYVLVMSTPAGLCRYVIGDIVRFVSSSPPRLIYVGRTKLQLSAFGEHVIEKELTDAISNVCQKHNWSMVNFHVAPLFANPAKGRTRALHEWWIELKVPTIETPTDGVLARELDMELIRLNDDYEAKRKGSGLAAPVVRLVIPGVFERWLRQSGKWGGQNKMPRCRSDRKVADELAKIAGFHYEY